MTGLELAGQASRLFPGGDGTDAHPKAHAPGAIISVDMDGEAARAELAGQPRRSAFFAERSNLDGEAV
jgi:hypothetical protein